MPEIPPGLLEWRKLTGADKWDEMWEGVLHMPPMPNREHQDLEWAMETYLRQRWAPAHGARVYHGINVASPGGWPKNYRIPDLVLMKPPRFGIDRNEYFEGAPDIVVEIRSPGDESYEKLEFYARIGVLEVWIINRDGKIPEIYILTAGQYVIQIAGTDGWILSPVTGIELRSAASGKLSIRLAGDDTTSQDLP
jgi:Uma2 family endonuclease